MKKLARNARCLTEPLRLLDAVPDKTYTALSIKDSKQYVSDLNYNILQPWPDLMPGAPGSEEKAHEMETTEPVAAPKPVLLKMVAPKNVSQGGPAARNRATRSSAAP